MNACRRFKIIVPVVSVLSAVALSAQAQDRMAPGGAAPPPAAGRAVHPVPGHPPAVAGRGVPGAHPQFAHGVPAARVYGGNPYRGRVAWEGGRWRHEVHDGRDGWWWDVGGVWYWYPRQMEGPPAYISEDYSDDIPVAAYDLPPDYAPPPPPPPDPGASAVGGAIVGGLLGGLLTGRVEGAAIGAVAGGATGAIAGATAAARPGYYFARGNCYFRYPSGQYVLADPRACY
jgi:hypothetical protein